MLIILHFTFVKLIKLCRQVPSFHKFQAHF